METTNKDESDESVASCGLTAINHAYNQGKISFKKWLELSRERALLYKEQLKGERKKQSK